MQKAVESKVRVWGDAAVLRRFAQMIEIPEGMSGDKKYTCVDPEGNRFLLRQSPLDQYTSKRKTYAFLQQLNKADLPIPKCIAFSKDDNAVHTLLSWMDGEEVEKVLPRLGQPAQYALGCKAGQVLAKIHKAATLDH